VKSRPYPPRMTEQVGPDRTLLKSSLERSGATLAPGLSHEELRRVEGRFGFSFAPDHRLMLSLALPLGGTDWPDWRSADESDLRERLGWPIEGILFDVGDGYWREGWGERPTATADALSVAREYLRHVPVLVPVFGHRYLPTDPPLHGNPVLSCYQTDVIFYGNDLLDWFAHEFHGRASSTPPDRRVPFWSDLVDEGDGPDEQVLEAICDGTQTQADETGFEAFGDALDDALLDAGAGRVNSSMAAGGEESVICLGPDAEAMFAEVEVILRSYKPCRRIRLRDKDDAEFRTISLDG